MTSAVPIKPEDHAAMTAQDWRRIVAAHPLWLEVTSDSMIPTLQPGDRIRVEPSTTMPAADTLLVFVQKGLLTVHRHLGGGRCRGDNRLRFDLPIGDPAVVGIVTDIERNGTIRTVDTVRPWTLHYHRCRLILREVTRRFLGLGVKRLRSGPKRP